MEVEIADLEKAVADKFFASFEEDQKLMDEILSSNSLKRFKVSVAKYGAAKIASTCILPMAPRTDTKRLFKSLNSTFIGDFI